MASKEMVSVRHLTKKYKDMTALDDISFSIKTGEVFGIIGPNGAGKTTTIECILGTKTYNHGEVELLGHKQPCKEHSLYEDVGAQFQEFAYPHQLKVYEICQLTASLYAHTKKYDDLLELFHLSPLRNRYIKDLSGGERQKLAILLAVIHEPRFLVLDELTTGLDPRARQDMWQFIQQLQKEGMTILLTSHYMDEVYTLCEKVAILNKGQIVAMGSPHDLMTKYQHHTFQDTYLHLTGEEVVQ